MATSGTSLAVVGQWSSSDPGGWDPFARIATGKFPRPTVTTWVIQRELPYKLVLDISYVGNTSRHQVYVQELEQLPLGYTTSTNILSTVNNVSAAILPYKGYSSINYTRFGAPAAPITACR